MGTRGPKSKFDHVTCPNPECANFGLREAGNIKGNGCYHGHSGIVRKYICHTYGGGLSMIVPEPHSTIFVHQRIKFYSVWI